MPSGRILHKGNTFSLHCLHNDRSGHSLCLSGLFESCLKLVNVIAVCNIDHVEGMIKEGREIAAIHPNMIVKIPMTTEGLKAVKVLNAEGIKTNVTLVFTSNQALLAARAGATYVSPFLGRLDDISVCGTDLISEIVEIFQVAGIDTEIIAASVRHPMHVTECALAGADIATVPYKVLEQMTKHPLTDQGIEKFQKDYIAVFGE